MRYKVTNTSTSNTVACTLGDRSSLYLYPKGFDGSEAILTEEQFTGYEYFNNVPFITVEPIEDSPAIVENSEAQLQRKTSVKRDKSLKAEDTEKEV